MRSTNNRQPNIGRKAPDHVRGFLLEPMIKLGC